VRALAVTAFLLPVVWTLAERMPGEVPLPSGSGLPEAFPESASPQPGSTLRRVELLNYLWQIHSSSGWIWGALGVSALLLFAGSGLLAGLAGKTDPRRMGAGVATMALALTVLYATVVPPFQAPDEPDHLLAYARIMGLPKLGHRAAQLARLGHLERLKFHPLERFRPGDVGRPYTAAWADHVQPEDVRLRSPLTAWNRLENASGDKPPMRVAPTGVVSIELSSVCVSAAVPAPVS